ncbi:Uncharacterized protein APZ42_011128 [Daphnia magna]|uniref:Uncharacterized protein n=1 Tax=Daphnia magna TaxID=35525 RepID=A0A162T398_9CRUS|nr:Uncharacterized protein APZ42_011128 [Daphnia magna]
MENLNENCILGLDFLASNNAKINTKNKQISYDYYGVEHSFSESILPLYSIMSPDGWKIRDKVTVRLDHSQIYCTNAPWCFKIAFVAGSHVCIEIQTWLPATISLLK